MKVIKITGKIVKYHIFQKKQQHFTFVPVCEIIRKDKYSSLYTILQPIPLFPGNEPLLILQTKYLKLVLSNNNANFNVLHLDLSHCIINSSYISF
jgi:hypothetical protein